MLSRRIRRLVGALPTWYRSNRRPHVGILISYSLMFHVRPRPTMGCRERYRRMRPISSQKYQISIRNRKTSLSLLYLRNRFNRFFLKKSRIEAERLEYSRRLKDLLELYFLPSQSISIKRKAILAAATP